MRSYWNKQLPKVRSILLPMLQKAGYSTVLDCKIFFILGIYLLQMGLFLLKKRLRLFLQGLFMVIIFQEIMDVGKFKPLKVF